MPVCVQPGLIPIEGGGQVEVMMPAPSPCPGGFEVLSSMEVSELQAIAANNLFTLTVEDGVLVSSSIATLWCIAWAIRATRRAL